MPDDHKTGATTFRPATTDPLRLRAIRILKGTAKFEDRLFTDSNELLKLVEILRSMGCVIALTMGVWDLHHHGHDDYMDLGKEETRKRYPDAEHVILVVGVDSDRLTQSRKGPRRPIIPEDERCLALKHVRPVDIIALQDSMTELSDLIPHETRIISESTTDLKSTDEMRKRCEQLVTLPPQATTSTSARVRKLILDGAQQVITRLKAQLDEAFKEAIDGLEF